MLITVSFISLSQILINEKVQLSLLLLTRDNYEQYSLDILMGYIMFQQFQKKKYQQQQIKIPEVKFDWIW